MRLDGRATSRPKKPHSCVLREKALKGDARALDRIIELAGQHNNVSAEMGPTQGLVVEDQAILDAFKAETIADAAAAGTTAATDGSSDNQRPVPKPNPNMEEPK